MTRFFATILLFLICLPCQAQVSLAGPDEGPKVKAQLVAEMDGIKPGQTFRVALRQEIAPGWHTYWRNPGDTGLETTIAWELPPGFSASPLLFPTPHRQEMSGLMNFGYENDVMIMADITPPADMKMGDKVVIKAKANWLVCHEVCIPESAEVSVTLPVRNDPAIGPWGSAFTAAAQKLPLVHQAKQSVTVKDEVIILSIDPLPLPPDELPEEAFFFPHDPMLIQNNAPQKLELNGRQAVLTLQKTQTRNAPIDKVAGDLWFRNATGERSYQFAAEVQKEKPLPALLAPAKTPIAMATMPEKKIGFIAALCAAFLGGLLLNLMPCVFPVLSLKALALVQKSQMENRSHVRLGGLVYLTGVLTTFAFLGLLLAVLRSTGHNVGWGAQLQSPVFAAAMALLLFFIGFSLTGAVTLGARVMGIGGGLAHKAGHAGTFFTGALAVIVATPCTAPFMGLPIFYALTQPWFVTLAVMLAIGFGLAFPYVLLTFVPNALRFLPRPGIWMEYFKQFLAFPMFAASIWLTWVIAHQTGAQGVLLALSSMLSLAFGFWLWKTSDNRLQTAWQVVKKLLAAGAVVFAFYLVMQQPSEISIQTVPRQADYFEPYTGGKLAELRSQNKAVFVNMTAAWCITCLANEKAALGTDKVRQFFKENDITYLKGDWTNYDEEITAFLRQFSRQGVPLYVFFPANQAHAPVVLPQLLTPDTIIDTIQHPTGETP